MANEGAGQAGAASGSGAGTAGAGSAGAGAGVSGAGASGAGLTSGATGSAGAGGDWTSALPELDRGYVQNKGWKSPQEVLSGYQNLEKLAGVPEARLLSLPEKSDDKEGWAKVYDRLGRPQKPEEYGLKGSDGKPTEFQAWASQVFHEAGLSRNQADAIISKWDQTTKAKVEAQNQEFNQKIELEERDLKKDWGLAYDQSVKQAQTAAREFGVTKEELDSMEQTMGYSKVMKFFQKLGSKISESNFVSGDPSNQGAMSPEAAKARIHALKSDTDFIRRLSNGETSAKDEVTRLTRFANPEYDN